MALSLPSAVFAFKGPSELHQAVLMCTMSFTSAWVAAVGLPMLVELAPNGRKGGILAWQMALEDVWGVVLAAIVGVPWRLRLPWRLTRCARPKFFAFRCLVRRHRCSPRFSSWLWTPHRTFKASKSLMRLGAGFRHNKKNAEDVVKVFAMISVLWGVALCCYSLLRLSVKGIDMTW